MQLAGVAGPLSPWSLRVVADLAAALVGLAVLPSVGWANVAYAAGVFVTLGDSASSAGVTWSSAARTICISASRSPTVC